jgi:hypothetical protein
LLSGCALLLLAGVVNAADTVPSFTNDVVPIFTRLGCNQGACHGKNAGQNGFRLSLRGYAPEQDYQSLTHEFQSRRINLAVPEDSLLLLKPLGKARHDGGKLFAEGSRAHQVLLEWLKSGMPGPSKDEPTLKQITIATGNRTAKVNESYQLVVTAEYGTGEKRDVTWLAKFDSNDTGIADIDADGKVSIRRTGETAIRVSFQGQVAVVLATVPTDYTVKPDLLAERKNFIDDHIFDKLGKLGIEPSDACDDATFIRRVFLDTIGTLPTPDEVRAFLKDTSADKRTKLVDGVLARPEFVDYWTLQLADLFQNRKERDHDVRGSKGVRAFHEWLRERVAANTPWDRLARDILTATGTSTENPAIGYFVVTVGEQREAHRSEIVGSAAQAFLGTRIGCAQCHNHPLERYTQDDYYHFAAYFSRIKLDRKELKQGPTTLSVSAPDPAQNKNPVGVTQPRTGKFMKPQPLDRSDSTVAPGDDPRAILADWITSPQNEYFSGAIVNRLWKHFLGTGLVEPVDDLRASNPPSNPELWKALTTKFVQKKYDLKHMMRLILLSRTYQLASATKPGNAHDTRFFSHYLPRRLQAEVLSDALSQVTQVPESFPGYPLGMHAMQLPDPSVRSSTLLTFGRSERVTACACERNDEVALPHTLFLLNNQELANRIANGDGRVKQLLKAGKADRDVVEELFLCTLSRLPSEKEWGTISAELATASNKEEFFIDLCSALVNTKEFLFGH